MKLAHSFLSAFVLLRLPMRKSAVALAFRGANLLFRQLLPILLPILMAACGRGGISVSAEASVALAIDAVNGELNELRGCLWIAPQGDFPIHVVVDSARLDAEGYEAATAPGEDSAIIFMNPQSEPLYLWRVAYLHELGHALGLQHEPSGLMYARLVSAYTYEQGKAELLKLLDEKGLMPACIERSNVKERTK